MAGTMRLGSELDQSRIAVVLILTFVRVAFFPDRLDVILFSRLLRGFSGSRRT